MTDVLYDWPDAARFGKTIPKTKFYEQGVASQAVRARFVTEVERITWAFKLAESTINLPSSGEVPEIQVLVITAKGVDVDDVVLAAIDKAVKQPVLFEIVTVRGTRMAATLKAGTRGGRYYSTGWSHEGSRVPLPPSVSLSNLYAALLEPLLPLRLRGGEGWSDVAERLAAFSRLEREVASLERKLRTEPQLNRKVELRHTLRTQQAKLADLTSSTIALNMKTTN